MNVVGTVDVCTAITFNPPEYSKNTKNLVAFQTSSDINMYILLAFTILYFCRLPLHFIIIIFAWYTCLNRF